MIKHFLAFEKQIADLEGKIEELRHLSSSSDINIAEEIGKLQLSVSEKLKSTYSQLSPWQKVLVSRHPERPHFQDIIKNLFEDYIPLSGDRSFSDDNALTGGIASFRGRSVVVIGIDKGKNTNIGLVFNNKKTYVIRSVNNEYAGISLLTDDYLNTTSDGIISKGPKCEGQTIWNDDRSNGYYMVSRLCSPNFSLLKLTHA